MKLVFSSPSAEIAKKYDDLFPVQNCFIEVNPGKVYLPRKFADIGESIKDLKVYEDDVWLVSYPRTGSTWAQEMIWLLGNNLDFEGAKKVQQVRCPVVELSAVFGEDHFDWVAKSIGNTVDYVRNMERKRFIRSHLPWHLLPNDIEISNPKIIYTARNPKDLCVSFYHYCKLIHGLNGTFEDFCEMFLSDQSPIGSYWKHVLPFWNRREQDNILFLKYEDMNRNLPKIVSQCVEFLEVDLELSEETMDKICDHLNFKKMQTNPAVNLDPLINHESNNVPKDQCSEKFIRKGKIGDWKNYLSNEMSDKFDVWIERNTRGTNLDFDYE